MNETVTLSPFGQWLRGRYDAFRERARGIGVFLLVVGWASAYWLDRSVIHYAQLKVSVGGLPSAFVLTVTLGVLGLICVIGGRGAVDTLSRRNLSWIRYAAFLTVCILLPAFLAFMWMLHVLDDFES